MRVDNKVQELHTLYAQAIAAILSNAGVAGSFYDKPLLGPRSITYYLQLFNSAQLKLILSMPEQIALDLRSQSVLIFRRGGLIVLQISLPKQHHIPVIRGQDTTGLEIGIGETFKQKVLFNFRIPHTLVAGTTGAGKSYTVKNIILGLIENHTPDELELVYIDPNSDFIEFENEVHTVRFDFGGNAIMKDDWAKVTAWLKSLVNQRRQHNLRNAKRIVVVVDEAEFIRDTSPSTYDQLVVIANQGRKYKINLILTSKKPTQGNLPNITHLAGNRFIGRIEVDNSTSTKMLGQSGIDLRRLGLEGDFLHYDDSGSLTRMTVATLPALYANNLTFSEKAVKEVSLVDNSAKPGRPQTCTDMKTLAYYFLNDPRKVKGNELGLTRSCHELHRDQCWEFGKYLMYFKKGGKYA